MTIATFATGTTMGFLIVVVALVAALVAAHTPPSQVLRALKPAAVILVISLLANTLIVVGNPDIKLAGGIGISTTGALRGFWAVARIVAVVGFATVFSITTMPPALADAVSWLISPLRHLGVPVADVSMSLSIALRFVPLAGEEAERIASAQRARGAELSRGGIIARLRRWAAILVPLVVALFRRADELACAMGDRCYTGMGRTSLSGRASVSDCALALGSIAIMVASLLPWGVLCS